MLPVPLVSTHSIITSAMLVLVLGGISNTIPSVMNLPQHRVLSQKPAHYSRAHCTAGISYCGHHVQSTELDMSHIFFCVWLMCNQQTFTHIWYHLHLSASFACHCRLCCPTPHQTASLQCQDLKNFQISILALVRLQGCTHTVGVLAKPAS